MTTWQQLRSDLVDAGADDEGDNLVLLLDGTGIFEGEDFYFRVEPPTEPAQRVRALIAVCRATAINDYQYGRIDDLSQFTKERRVDGEQTAWVYLGADLPKGASVDQTWPVLTKMTESCWFLRQQFKLLG